MKRFTLISGIYLMLVSVQCIAKTNTDLVKANYLYTHLAFYEAITYYEKLAQTMNDPDLYTKLGDCYRLTKNPIQAAAWYSKAMVTPGAPEIAKLHYAEVLMSLERYSDALVYLKQYQQTMPHDRRVSNMIASCEQINAMKKAMPNGTAIFESFNTDGSDFGPSIRNSSELFFTVDTVVSGTGKTDMWTGSSFYKIYSIACNQYQCGGELRKLGKNINTKYHDGPCTFSADGNTMYFTRTNVVKRFLTKSPLPDENNVVNLQIMIASDYDANDRTYKSLTPFKYNSTEYSVAHPTVSSDGNMMLFASDMPGGEGGNDLYVSRKDATGNWSRPENVGKAINTEGNEMFPFIGTDNTLYFASDGWVGYGGLDVYAAKWNSSTNSFSKPVNMGMPVNSSYDDMSFVLQASGDEGYFASNRPAQMKGDNIYGFDRMGIFLSLHVVDATSGIALPNSQIQMQTYGSKYSYITDETGKAFIQLAPNANFTFNVTKAGYDTAMTDASTKGIFKSDTLHKTVKLKMDFKIQYNVVVLDEQTRQPIENPMLVFVQNNPRRQDTTMLGTGQTFTRSLEPDKFYNVYAVKENYYGNEKFVSTKNLTPNANGVRLNDTIYMKKLQVGQVYNIDNIYYDFDKANIREDAKTSLDRLLNLLETYPNMRIQINSHTDCRGSDAYNKKLSNARANSVVKYLQLRGVNLTRLKYRGYGESMPVEKCTSCDNCTEAQHQRNRRTEFQILTM